jgi:hypothetical protein
MDDGLPQTCWQAGPLEQRSGDQAGPAGSRGMRMSAPGAAEPSLRQARCGAPHQVSATTRRSCSPSSAGENGICWARTICSARTAPAQQRPHRVVRPPEETLACAANLWVLAGVEGPLLIFPAPLWISGPPSSRITLRTSSSAEFLPKRKSMRQSGLFFHMRKWFPRLMVLAELRIPQPRASGG